MQDFTGLRGYQPQKLSDDEDFPKLNGRYVAKIESCMRKEGIGRTSGNPYDFYGMKLRITEVVSGDKGENRILDATFNNDEAGLKRLADSLFTAGLDVDISSEEAIDRTIANCVEREVKIRTWVWKERDVQMVRFVSEFKAKKGDTAKEEKAPF